MQSFPPSPPVAGAAVGPADSRTVWTSPGTVSDAPRFRSAPTVLAPPAPASRALPGSPLARLQPRTVGQLLDGGFEVVRFRFRTVAVVAAAIVGPLYVLPQLLLLLSGVTTSTTDAFRTSNPFLGGGFQSSTSYWSSLGTAGLVMFSQLLASMLLGVSVTHLLGGWLVGNDPDPVDTLRFTARRAPVAIAAFAMVFAVKAVVGLVSCSIGLIYIVPALSVLAPVVAAEQAGPVAAISRTFRLTRRRIGAVIGVSMLWILASTMVTSGLQLAAAAIGAAVARTPEGIETGVQAATVAGGVVLLVVQVAVTALVYFDLRVRTEGLDLQLEARERFHVAAA